MAALSLKVNLVKQKTIKTLQVSVCILNCTVYYALVDDSMIVKKT